MSGAVAFDPDLAARIAVDHEDGDWPIIPTAAGHDAGILSAQGIPTAMLFVRNPTGVSHSPAETASMPGLPGRRARAGRDARAAGDVSTSYLLERAWVDGAVHDDVLVEIDGRPVHQVDLSRDSHLSDATRREGQFHRDR